MTRSSDRFVTLGNRVNFAKSRKADLFVAIHNNASLKKTDHGACVYYPNSGYKEEVGSEGKMAAASIQKQLVALGLKKMEFFTGIRLWGPAIRINQRQITTP